MTLVNIEGFDSQVAKKFWTVSGGGFSAGPFGGSATHGGSTWTGAAGLSTFISGFHHYVDVSAFTGSNSLKTMLTVRDENVLDHMFLRFDNSGTVTLFRGGTSLVTSSLVYPSNQWNWVELKCTIADSGGIFVLNVNGTNFINFTGDTRNGGTSTNVFQVKYCDAASSAQRFDDLYICDAGGSAPYNDFLGECKIETLRPSGNGTYSQLVGSDGNSTDNYLLVDETVPSLTDYVGSATVGQRDTYAFNDLSTTSGSILAVQTSALAYKSDAGAASMKTIERLSGGTERLSAAAALVATPGSWVTDGPKITDPASASWTVSSVNGSEFGVEVA